MQASEGYVAQNYLFFRKKAVGERGDWLVFGVDTRGAISLVFTYILCVGARHAVPATQLANVLRKGGCRMFSGA